MRKDHKTSLDVIKGHPLRPVCGAIISCNYRISHFLSSIIKPFINEAEEPCNSTEDLLYRISTCNRENDVKYCIIGSFDVKALYPSIDIEFAVKKCEELMMISNINLDNFDITEVGLYLEIVMSKAKLIEQE